MKPWEWGHPWDSQTGRTITMQLQPMRAAPQSHKAANGPEGPEGETPAPSYLPPELIQKVGPPYQRAEHLVKENYSQPLRLNVSCLVGL